MISIAGSGCALILITKGVLHSYLIETEVNDTRCSFHKDLAGYGRFENRKATLQILQSVCNAVVTTIIIMIIISNIISIIIMAQPKASGAPCLRSV